MTSLEPLQKIPLPIDSLPVIGPYRDGRLPIILEATQKLLDRYGDLDPILFLTSTPEEMERAVFDCMTVPVALHWG